MAEESLKEEIPSLESDPSPTKAEIGSPTRSNKVDIILKATGDAPIMRKKKWAVPDDKTVGWVIDFLKQYLKCDPHESLFLYVHQTFAPSPDQDIKNLFECYGSDGKLVLHYCKSEAWG